MSQATHTKSSLPWQGAGEIVEYFIEVGTTPYGKYGLYKEMIPVGTGSRGRHMEMAREIRLSNPEVFENLELREVVSRG